MSKSKRRLDVTPEYILEFMRAVYPGYADLALASFNEEMALTEATHYIRRLEAKLRSLASECAECGGTGNSGNEIDGDADCEACEDIRELLPSETVGAVNHD